MSITIYRVNIYMIVRVLFIYLFIVTYGILTDAMYATLQNQYVVLLFLLEFARMTLSPIQRNTVANRSIAVNAGSRLVPTVPFCQ